MTDVFEVYIENRNEARAVSMEKYLKNQFPFLGIPKSIRGNLTKPFLIEAKKKKQIDWEFVFECYGKDEREFLYLGLDYVRYLRRFLTPDDLPYVKRMIETKSWWESVDPTFDLVGEICKQDPSLIESEIAAWSKSENIWLARVAICFQMRYKAQTDTAILERYILENCDTKEFFLNKAIGWILREYGKTNPTWVVDFVKRYEMRLAPLSKREALRRII